MNTIIQKFSGTDLDISIGPVYDISDALVDLSTCTIAVVARPDEGGTAVIDLDDSDSQVGYSGDNNEYISLNFNSTTMTLDEGTYVMTVTVTDASSNVQRFPAAPDFIELQITTAL